MKLAILACLVWIRDKVLFPHIIFCQLAMNAWIKFDTLMHFLPMQGIAKIMSACQDKVICYKKPSALKDKFLDRMHGGNYSNVSMEHCLHLHVWNFARRFVIYYSLRNVSRLHVSRNTLDREVGFSTSLLLSEWQGKYCEKHCLLPIQEFIINHLLIFWFITKNGKYSSKIWRNLLLSKLYFLELTLLIIFLCQEIIIIRIRWALALLKPNKWSTKTKATQSLR